jgi:dephospho-CoA kinase
MGKNNFVLGICGKIGSGKTEVLNILHEQGWVTIDSDKIVHNLYEAGGAGQRKITDFFGEEFLKKDGTVNRGKLRKVVFKDVKKLKILNTLIHPLVLSEISKIIDKCDEGEKIAVEAIYFDEKFLGQIVDKILWIDRPVPEIRKFLIKTRGFSEGIADNVLGLANTPVRVDAELENNSTLKALEKKVIIAVEKLI